MPRHHYLPAAYLGNFSEDQNNNVRDNQLYVKDLNEKRTFKTSANNIGCITNYYPELVDKSFGGYEAKILTAIELLIQHKILALDWASTLVQFIAGMLVRGPDFKRRFEKRIEAFGDIPLGDNNTDFARLFEHQRLLTVIAAAEWVVMEIFGDGLLITNDIGYMPFLAVSSPNPGIAIPLTSRYILGIFPSLVRAIAYTDGSEWYPVIKYVRLDRNNHHGFNETMCKFADRFIYCGSADTIRKYPINYTDRNFPIPEPGELGFNQGLIAMKHDMGLFELITLFGTPPDKKESWKHISRIETKEPLGNYLARIDFRKLPDGFIRINNLLYINLVGHSPFWQETGLKPDF
jgi:hypothetical protein